MTTSEDRIEADIEHQVRLFPERYPTSWGGLMPDEQYFANQANLLNDQLPDGTGHPDFGVHAHDDGDEMFDEGDENPEDRLGVHALDDGADTFDPLSDNDEEPGYDDDRFDPEF